MEQYKKLFMKRYMIYICFLMITLLSPAFSANAVASQSPKILVINSYRITYWSASLADAIEKELLKQYPGAQVYVENLNANILPKSIDMTFRSIMWSLVDRKLETVTYNAASTKSTFPPNVFTPDIIVIIGEDAFLYYQAIGFMADDTWRGIPVVLCGVNEFIIEDIWNPVNPYKQVNPYIEEEGIYKKMDFDSLEPIEEKRNIKVFVHEADKTEIDTNLIPVKATENGFLGYQVDLSYNLTGIKATIPIKGNLNLIHKLIPDLQEIVWIDYDYYAANYAYWLFEKEIKDKYPSLKFSSINPAPVKMDSIYNEMLKPVSGKAYLTYAWNIDGNFNKHSDEQLRSLFRNYSSVPLFSLTERSPSDSYWVGGCHRPYNKYVPKIVNQIDRILKGTPANSIPFEIIDEEVITLDQPLLDKYGLLENARKIDGITYQNKPPGYFEKNENRIFFYIIVITILLGLIIYWITRFNYNKKVRAEYVRYKKLYDRLHLIYGHTAIDFALYDEKGECIFRILNGKEQDIRDQATDLLAGNLFESSYLNAIQIERIRNKKPINIEVITDASGKFSPGYVDKNIYQVLINPLDNENYQLAKHIAIAINLTPVIRERKEKERFESLLNFASNSSQIGMAFYDITTKHGVATQSWYANLNEPSLPGVLPEYLSVVEEDRDILLHYRERIMKGIHETFNKEIRVIDDEKQKHWIDERIYVNENDKNMLIEFNVNIDEQKKTEDNLRMAKEKAEQSNLETEEFLNNINHEVRTPLNAIVGFSAILAASENEAERNDYIPLILRNNRLLTMLIDDIIELSKIDSGQTTFAYEPVNVVSLFDKLMEYGYLNLYGKRLNVISDISEDNPIVYTDANYLNRLMLNLLTNAIKFTETGSVVLGYRRRKSEYYFYVKDTGCGISKESQKRIFKRFDKLDSYVQGTGLGLALYKTIVEHLGGEIGLESEAGKGSTFWFTLPIK